MQFPNPLDVTARLCRFGLEYRAEAKRTRAASYLAKEAVRRELHVIGKSISGLKRPVTQQDTEQVTEQYDAQYPQHHKEVSQIIEEIEQSLDDIEPAIKSIKDLDDYMTE